MEMFSPCSLMPDGHLDKCIDCVRRDKTRMVEDIAPVRKKTPVKKRKPSQKKPRGRPKVQLGKLSEISVPEDGAAMRAAWIEAHRQKGFRNK